MKIKCPNCNKIHQAPDEYKSQKVKCFGCNQVFEAIDQAEIEKNELVERENQLRQKWNEEYEKQQAEKANKTQMIMKKSPSELLTFMGIVMVIVSLLVLFYCSYSSYYDTVYQQIAAINSSILTAIKCLGFAIAGLVFIVIGVFINWQKTIACEIHDLHYVLEVIDRKTDKISVAAEKNSEICENIIDKRQP